MLYIRMLYLIANDYRYMSFSLYYPAYHIIFLERILPCPFFRPPISRFCSLSFQQT